MKRLLVFMLLLCCWQQAEGMEFKWGMRFGATVSMLAGSDWELYKDALEAALEADMPGLSVSHRDYWGWGFTAGLALELSLGRFLALQPELLDTTYHGGVKLQNDDWSSDWAKIGTIYRLAELPVLLKLRFSKKLAVFAGPLVMYRFLPPKLIVIAPDYRDSEPLTDDSGYGTLAYGVVGGIEYHSTDEVVLEARYNYNLTSFDNYGYPFRDDTVFHGVILSVGFLF
ncbi:MAG: PorT family protein [Spirochaetales bacterium]|nr:PorT family protein [Spirochaetales bacterium]